MKKDLSRILTEDVARAADMPFLPDPDSDIFKTILSRNDFHRPIERKSTETVSRAFHTNKDLLDMKETIKTRKKQVIEVSQTQDVPNLSINRPNLADCKQIVVRPQSIRSTRSRAKSGSRGTTNSSNELTPSMSSGLKQQKVKRGGGSRNINYSRESPIPISQTEKVEAQSRKFTRDNVSECSLKQSIRKFQRRLEFNKDSINELKSPPELEAHRSGHGKPSYLRLKFKAKDFKLAAELINHAWKKKMKDQQPTRLRRGIGSILKGSTDRPPKTRQQAIRHEASVTSSLASFINIENSIIMGEQVQPRSSSQGRANLEFSFRPNAIKTKDDFSYEDIIQSIASELDQDKHTQTKMVHLIDRLRKATTQGLNWEEALQIQMIKTHMHAKALLFYQRNTKRKFLAKFISAYLRLKVDQIEREDLPPPRYQKTKSREVFMASQPTFGPISNSKSISISYNAESHQPVLPLSNFQTGRQYFSPVTFVPATPNDAMTSELEVGVMTERSEAQYEQSSNHEDHKGEEIQPPYETTVPQKQQASSRSIIALMRSMDKSQKSEILKREKSLNKIVPEAPEHLKVDNSKAIYRGVKKIVRLIRRVRKRNKLSLESAFGRWKELNLGEFGLAAEEFHQQVLLSKALQSWSNFTCLRIASKSVLDRIKRQKDFRMLTKSFFVLQTFADQQKQKNVRNNLADRIYTCKLQQIAFKAWHSFASVNARIKQVNVQAKTVAQQFLTIATQKTEQNQYKNQDSVMEQSAIEPYDWAAQAKAKVLKKVFSFFKTHYLHVVDFKVRMVERYLRLCLAGWKKQVTSTLLITETGKKKNEYRRIKMVWKGWLQWVEKAKQIGRFLKSLQATRTRLCFRSLKLYMQAQQRKKETLANASLLYSRRVLLIAFEQIHFNLTLAKRQRSKARKLVKRAQRKKISLIMKMLKEWADLNKKGHLIRERANNPRKIMHTTFHFWIRELVNTRKVNLFRNTKLMVRAFWAYRNGLEKQKQQRDIIFKLVQQSQTKIKSIVIRALSHIQRQTKDLEKLTQKVSLRQRRDILVLVMHTLRSHAQIVVSLREKQVYSAKKLRKQTKSKVLKAWRHLSNKNKNCRQIVCLLSRKRAIRNLRTFYKICHQQRSLRERFIDFASQRIKQNCQKLFEKWNRSAQSKRKLQHSLTSRQHLLLCKLALKRLKIHAVKSLRFKQFIVKRKAIKEKELQLKVIRSFIKNVQSQSTRLRKMARLNHCKSLMVRALHGLLTQVDKAREVNQIVCERNERQKQKFLQLWCAAFSAKRRGESAKYAIILLRKRQVLFRMRIFLRLVKEKQLKARAAAAFKAIWLKRTAFNGLAEGARYNIDKNVLQLQLFDLYLKNRQKKILLAWSRVARGASKRKAFAHLIQRRQRKSLLNRFFTTMKVKALQQATILALAERNSDFMKQAIFLAFKANLIKCKQAFKLADQRADKVFMIKKQTIFDALHRYTDTRVHRRKAGKQIQFRLRQKLLAKCFKSLTSYSRKCNALRVAQKRIIVKLLKNLKRKMFKTLIQQFEKAVNRRLKKEHDTIEYDEDESEMQPNQDLRDVNATMRLSMLDTKNPMFLVSLPVNESHNRLFRTPEDARLMGSQISKAENRLLCALPQASKIEILTRRINQRLETRSNRSCSTKIRSRSGSQENQRHNGVMQSAHLNKPKQFETLSTRPPLLPTTLKKVFPENSVSPKIKRMPNLRYSSTESLQNRALINMPQVFRSYRDTHSKNGL